MTNGLHPGNIGASSFDGGRHAVSRLGLIEDGVLSHFNAARRPNRPVPSASPPPAMAGLGATGVGGWELV